VPIGREVLGHLKSVFENLVTRASSKHDPKIIKTQNIIQNCIILYVKFSKFVLCPDSITKWAVSLSCINTPVLRTEAFGILFNLVDITNTQFTRHSQWGKFRDFHWMFIGCSKAERL